jgi:hypothetical protein
MFSSVGRHDTRMQVKNKFDRQLKVAVTRNINANNVIHIKQQQYKTKKIKATIQKHNYNNNNNSK